MLAARLPSILPPLARTLADLDGKATVGRIHLAEVISYRIAGERMTALPESKRGADAPQVLWRKA
jgi:predicted ATPase with chaperone activity